jgi:hypothetical protein
MIKQNKIIDPLESLQQDGFKKLNELLKINHHSPTSASMPLGIYVYRYLLCTQLERREFEGNANMAAGVAVGDALADHYSNVIWSMHPIRKKLAPRDHNKLSKDEAITKALNKFKEYVPVNDKDQEKKDHYLETIPQTIHQGFIALDSLGINNSNQVVAEDSINFKDKRLSLPGVGRTDIHFEIQSKKNKVFNSSEQSGEAPSSNDATFLSDLVILELKTAWQKPGKVKKDGSRSFSSARLPSLPNINHLSQLAFYVKAKSSAYNVSPLLCYLTADGFKIFTKDNCTDLEPENLNNYYERFVNSCLRKERLLARHIDLDEPDMILKEIIKDVDPEFSHPFYWSIGNKYLSKAKKIWSNT